MRRGSKKWRIAIIKMNRQRRKDLRVMKRRYMLRRTKRIRRRWSKRVPRKVRARSRIPGYCGRTVPRHVMFLNYVHILPKRCRYRAYGRRYRLPLGSQSYTITAYFYCYRWQVKKKNAGKVVISTWGSNKGTLRRNEFGTEGQMLKNDWKGWFIKSKSTKICSRRQYYRVAASYNANNRIAELWLRGQVVARKRANRRPRVNTKNNFCAGGRTTTVRTLVRWLSVYRRPIPTDALAVLYHPGYRNWVLPRLFFRRQFIFRRPTCYGHWWGLRTALPSWRSTVEAWVAPARRGNPRSAGIAGWGTARKYQAFILQLDGQSIKTHYWEGRRGGLSKSLGRSMYSGGWKHFAVTYDGRVQRLYVHKRQVASRVMKRRPRVVNRRTFCVGKAPGTGYFRGRILGFKIYAYARNAASLRKSVNSCW